MGEKKVYIYFPNHYTAGLEGRKLENYVENQGCRWSQLNDSTDDYSRWVVFAVVNSSSYQLADLR